MKVSASTFPRKLARVTGAPSCEVNANSGAGAIVGSGKWSKARRDASSGRTSIADVTTSDAGLSAFLSSLERSRLRVECPDAAGESYTFAWASGYRNGAQIRVQGALESPQRPWPV